MLATLAVFPVTAANAATACTAATNLKTWNGSAADGDWATGANWTPAGAPVAASNVCINATDEITVNTAPVAVTAVESTAPITVNGQAFSVSSATVASGFHNTLTLHGSGTIGGASAMTVDGGGGLVWDGGGGFIGAGVLTVAVGTPAQISEDYDAGSRFVAKKLVLNGPSTLSGSAPLYFNGGIPALVTIGGTMTITGDTDFQWDGTGSTPSGLRVPAGGTLVKTDSVATTFLNVPLENDGTVRAESGLLAINGGSGTPSSAGRFTSDGGTAAFTSGQSKLDTGANFTGTDPVFVDGGELTINTGATATVPVAGAIELRSGLIDGAGTLSVLGTLTLDGGTLDGAGATSIDGVFDLPDSFSGIHDVRRKVTVNAAGVLSWSGARPLSLANGALLTIAGQFNSSGDGQIANYVGGTTGSIKVVAGGVLLKSGATGGTLIQVPLENEGTVRADAGFLDIAGTSGTAPSGGKWLASTGASVLISNGFSFEGSATVLAGGGRVRITSILTMAPAAAAKVDAGATLELSSGAINGAGALTVNGAMKWTGASTLDGTGTLTIPGTLAVDSSRDSSTRFLGRKVTLSGTGTWTGADDIAIYNGGLLTVSGTLSVRTIGRSIYDGGGGTNLLKVVAGGKLIRDSGSGSSLIGVALENDGTVEALKGTLDTSGGSGTASSGGRWSATAPAAVQITGGQQKLDGTPVVDGSGRVTVIGGGQMSILTGITATVAAGGTLENATGAVDGAGTLTVNGTLRWSSYGSFNGTGATNVPGTLLIDSSVAAGTRSLGRKLTLSGTGTWTGATDISVLNNALFTISGTLTVRTGTRQLYDGGGGTNLVKVLAGGKLLKAVTGGTTSITAPLENDGTVQSDAGVLSIGGGSGAASSGGRWSATGQSILNFTGGVQKLDAAPSFDGTGHVRVNGGQLTVANAVTATVLSGAKLELASGTFDGNGTLSVPAGATLLWNGGGTLAGTGPTTIVGALVLNTAFNSNAKSLLRPMTVNAAATAQWTGPADVTMGNGAVMTLAGPLAVQNSQSWYFAGGATPSINVTATGSITKSGLTGQSYFGTALSMAGKATAQIGTLNLAALTNLNTTTGALTGTGQYFVSGGAQIGLPGNVVSNSALLSINGTASDIINPSTTPALANLATNTAAGKLLLTAKTIATAAAFSNAGRLDLAPNATFSADAGFAQTATGVLASQVTGTVPGTSVGRVVVTGNAALAGTLALKTSVLYTPAQSADLLTHTTRSGAFATITGGSAFQLDTSLATKTTLRTAALPSVSVGDIRVKEGAAGSPNALVPIKLSAASSRVVTVSVKTGTTGTATAGSDFTAVPDTTVTWAVGDPLTKTLAVPISGDTLGESDETVVVDASSPTNAVIGDAQGLLSILDEEQPVRVSIGDAATTEGNAGPKTLSVPVKLSQTPAVGQTITVDYATAATGTATPSPTGSPGTGDYEANSGTLTFTSVTGATQNIDIQLNGDATVEPNETINVDLTPAAGLVLADASGKATIVNDDGAATPAPGAPVSIGDPVVLEGNAATATLSFVASIPAAVAANVTFTYQTTAAGSANPGSDFTAVAATTGTIPAGSTSVTLPVTVAGDLVFEGNEDVRLALSAPSANAVIADDTGVGTILDEEGPLGVTVSEMRILEGDAGTVNAVFTVALTGAPVAGQTVTVDYATADGAVTPATAGSDYTAASGTLTFTPATATQTVSVPVSGDTTVEPNELLTLGLSNPVGLVLTSLGDPSGDGLIFNDD